MTLPLTTIGMVGDNSEMLPAQATAVKPAEYRPIRRLAVGGMAEVWVAEAHFRDGRVLPVAIKRVLPQIADPMFRAMFIDEARLGMALRHPNIIRVHDAREVAGAYIMVMELVEGDDVKGLLDLGRPLPVHSSLFVGRAIARALEYVHSASDESGQALGIVHRDVSPQNILLGNKGQAKLSDFGLADARTHAAVRTQNQIGGKLGYLSPDLVLRGHTDAHVDRFGLGIVLWEMLAGRRLFQGRDDGETIRLVAQCQVPRLSSLGIRVPKMVDDWLQRLLHPDAAARPCDAATLRAEAEYVTEHCAGGTTEEDLARFVKLHLARKHRDDPPVTESIEMCVADSLAAQMDDFVQGAAPLDPTEFLDYGTSNSGVRTRPTK